MKEALDLDSGLRHIFEFYDDFVIQYGDYKLFWVFYFSTEAWLLLSFLVLFLERIFGSSPWSSMMVLSGGVF